MVSFNKKFFLAIANLIVICIIYNFVSPSSLVFVSMIPALIYGIYTKRFFLILFTLMILGVVIGLFTFLVIFPSSSDIIVENIQFAVYLYTQLFPFEMSINILSLMNIEVIFWIGIVIFSILLASMVLKINEFRMMVIVSYFIMLFTAFFLIFNVFFYLIPELRVLILTNSIIQYVLFFFYAILPILVLTLSLLFIECLVSGRDRKTYQKDVKALDKRVKKNGKLRKLLTILSYFMILVIVIVMITMVSII